MLETKSNIEGHFDIDTQRVSALDCPAISDAEAKELSPGTSPRRRQRHNDAQLNLAATSGPAVVATKPIALTPDRTPSCDGQSSIEAHSIGAIAGDDGAQRPSETHSRCSPVIAEIRVLWHRRQNWHRAEKSMTVQASAICRSFVGVKGKGDKAGLALAAALLKRIEKGEATEEEADAAIACLPILMGRQYPRDARKKVEKELEKLAKALPIYPWVESIRGFGALSLAGLVGECGDIGSYKSISALWKRLGLAVIHGGRQRRVAGVEALDHGYSPSRRSVSWNLGVSLMRAQRAGDRYRDFYDREKEKQLAKVETKGHAHNRATRHMTKEIIKHLYLKWRELDRGATAPAPAPAPVLEAA